MKLELTAAAVQDLERLPAPVRDSVLGALAGLASDPDRLDQAAVPVAGEDADLLDLPVDAVAEAATGHLKAVGVVTRGGWLDRARPSVRVYFTGSAGTLAVMAVSTHERQAVH